MVMHRRCRREQNTTFGMPSLVLSLHPRSCHPLDTAAAGFCGMGQLVEKEKQEGTEKVYDERMDMIMEVCMRGFVSRFCLVLKQKNTRAMWKVMLSRF